jgi:hypothetical protein
MGFIGDKIKKSFFKLQVDIEPLFFLKNKLILGLYFQLRNYNDKEFLILLNLALF